MFGSAPVDVERDIFFNLHGAIRWEWPHLDLKAASRFRNAFSWRKAFIREGIINGLAIGQEHDGRGAYA